MIITATLAATQLLEAKKGEGGGGQNNAMAGSSVPLVADWCEAYAATPPRTRSLTTSRTCDKPRAHHQLTECALVRLVSADKLIHHLDLCARVLRRAVIHARPFRS